jgi:hypothetical protein
MRDQSRPADDPTDEVVVPLSVHPAPCRAAVLGSDVGLTIGRRASGKSTTTSIMTLIDGEFEDRV